MNEPSPTVEFDLFVDKTKWNRTTLDGRCVVRLASERTASHRSTVVYHLNAICTYNSRQRAALGTH